MLETCVLLLFSCSLKPLIRRNDTTGGNGMGGKVSHAFSFSFFFFTKERERFIRFIDLTFYDGKPTEEAAHNVPVCADFVFGYCLWRTKLSAALLVL